MNLSDAWTQAGITGSIVFVGGLAYKAYVAVNHKRCRSNCFGKELQLSIDIEETTPPSDKKTDGFQKNNPMVVVDISSNGIK
jgi:hypothetical protein